MKRRILWMSFLITAVALVIFSLVSTAIYYQGTLSYAQEHLRAYMGVFDESKTVAQMNDDYARELSEKLNGARVTFLSAEGKFLADSQDGNTDSRADRPEVQEALRSEKGEGFDVRASRTVGKELVYYCRNFGDRLVRIALPTDSLGGAFLRSLPAVVIFLVADAFLCLLFTYLATGYMLRPMEKLVRDASSGETVETESPELKPVARLLNRMKGDVATRVREIDEERELVLRAQRSKDEFIANITHEMNTPLTSIKGFAELLASGALRGERAQKAAQTILTQSERLTNLVASVINYNEIASEDLPTYEVNATHVTKELLETLAPAFAEKKLVLLSDVADGVVLQSRYERVMEIFGNLVRNAIRYNREGGSVSVLLSKEEFCVSDTGVGISEENLGRVFDRFFTVDKSHGGKNGGFGLGLSIVRKLCDKEGWSLSVESKEGVGSTFRVRFSEAKSET